MRLLGTTCIVLMAVGAWAGAASQPATGPAASAPASSAASSSWPADAKGLLFRTNADRLRRVLAWDAQGKPLTSAGLKPQGMALLGPGMSLRLEGGSFVDAKAGASIAAAAADGLSIEVYFTPASLKQSGRLLSIGTSRADGAWLQQQGDELFSSAQNVATQPAGKLSAAEPTHAALTRDKDVWTLYVNGRTAGAAANYRGLPADSTLVIGSDPTGKLPWAGQVWAVAIYRRALTPQEVAASAAAVAAVKPAIARANVLARLIDKSAYDQEPPEQGTYDRVWCVNKFQVLKVLWGEVAAREIRVAQWIFVGRELTTHSATKVGDEMELVLEPMEAHRELDAEMSHDDFSEETTPQFVDVGPLVPAARGK